MHLVLQQVVHWLQKLVLYLFTCWKWLLCTIVNSNKHYPCFLYHHHHPGSTENVASLWLIFGRCLACWAIGKVWTARELMFFGMHLVTKYLSVRPAEVFTPKENIWPQRTCFFIGHHTSDDEQHASGHRLLVAFLASWGRKTNCKRLATWAALSVWPV